MGEMPSSSSWLPCRQWHHTGYAPSYNGQHWPTKSLPCSSHIAGWCFRWQWGMPGTFHGMLAFQHSQASNKCCRIVLAFFCLMDSSIMSKMTCMTAVQSSRSQCNSTCSFVTILAMPLLLCLLNCQARRLPNQRSRRGTIPRYAGEQDGCQANWTTATPVPKVLEWQ